MVIETCPTEIIAASRERVWELLSDPEALARWAGTTLLAGPAHQRLVVGDRLILDPGFGLTVTLLVRASDPPHQLEVTVRLPFGVVNEETVVLTPLDAGRCRVGFG